MAARRDGLEGFMTPTVQEWNNPGAAGCGGLGAPSPRAGAMAGGAPTIGALKFWATRGPATIPPPSLGA